jgi:hypothetical protein
MAGNKRTCYKYVSTFPIPNKLTEIQQRIKTIVIFKKTHNCLRVITKLPNSEQSYKGKVKTHNYLNRQNQSTTGKL